MPLELVLGLATLVSMILYVLFGGADFGGGVWDAAATGPRAEAQRRLVRSAIAPVWEANHVWLILVVVLLFVVFSKAFWALSIALHIPLSIMLVGIVLRGSAFVFRAYGAGSSREQQHWSRVFAIASVVTPVMLGVCAGAVASGAIAVQGRRVLTDFVSAWFAPFPFAIGFLTLALCAYLAAVYLPLETRDPELRRDFRARALVAAVAVGVAAGVSILLSARGAPLIHDGLTARSWSVPFQVLVGLVAVGAMAALWTERYALARVLAPAQVTLILVGWAGAQYPYVVPPSLTLSGSAAPASVLSMVLSALLAGLVVLVPSLLYLFRVFKSHPVAPGQEEED